MSFQSDEAALVDLMDREVMVTRLADRIHDCTPPQVFGVHGDWGAGKTSFLHQLFLRLAGECPQNPAWTKDHPEQGVWTAKSKKYADRITTVWFEAWRYQREAEHAVSDSCAEPGRCCVSLVEMNGIVVARSLSVRIHAVLGHEPLEPAKLIAYRSIGNSVTQPESSPVTMMVVEDVPISVPASSAYDIAIFSPSHFVSW